MNGERADTAAELRGIAGPGCDVSVGLSGAPRRDRALLRGLQGLRGGRVAPVHVAVVGPEEAAAQPAVAYQQHGREEQHAAYGARLPLQEEAEEVEGDEHGVRGHQRGVHRLRDQQHRDQPLQAVHGACGRSAHVSTRRAPRLFGGVRLTLRRRGVGLDVVGGGSLLFRGLLAFILVLGLEVKVGRLCCDARIVFVRVGRVGTIIGVK